MILAELNMLLVNVARSNYLVNDAFVGDVYTINGKENRFGCFVATPMTAVKQGIGLIQYNYVLYYVDRLTKKEDNTDYVQSDAVSLLSGVIDYIESQGIEVESGYEFTLFRQQFGDWCAGAYVSVRFNCPYNDCNDGEFNISGYDLGSISIDTNGIYEPVGVDGYNRITVNVPQVGATEEWVDDEITTRLQGYATEDWVNGRGFLTEHQDLSLYATISYVDDAVDGLREELPDLTTFATKNWVQNQGYIKSNALTGYASENWVNNQGFLKDDDLAGLAAVSWVENQGFVTSDDIDDMATKTWVRNQGYIDSSSLVGYATRSWVGQQGFLIEDDLCDYATKDWVNQQGFLTEDDLCGYATEEWTKNWVENQGYIKLCDLDPYATKNWVENQGYVNEAWIDAQGFATEVWVNQQGFATEIWVNEQGFATESWVINQNYATESWVINQNYATETYVNNQISADLEGYATEQWVLDKHYLDDDSDYFRKSSVWTGTEDEWELLTPEQQASYIIALVTYGE